MKCFNYLASLAAVGAIAACGSSHVDPNIAKANNEDRASSICHNTARAKHLKVSSSEEPYPLGNSRYVVQFKTRDAAGVVSRRCDVDLANGKANIY